MTVLAPFVAIGMVAGVFLCIETGQRLGGYRRSRNSGKVQPLVASIEGAIFGLMGLLVSFTFYGAGSRFEARRSIVVREANAISTSYLRLDLLPPERQPELREEFRRYLQSRLDIFAQFPNVPAVKVALNRSSALQKDLWMRTVDAVRETGPAEKSLILASLNQVIDITTDSTVALTTHPPVVVFVMLVLTVIISSIVAGYDMSASETRDWISTVSFALVVGIALYMILDYEFPRIGFIRIDPVDQVLVDTLNAMK